MNLRRLLGGALNGVFLISPLVHVVDAHGTESISVQPEATIAPAPASSPHTGIEQTIKSEVLISSLPHAPLLEHAATVYEEDETQPNGKTHAMAAAVADGVTTGMALSAGALETNPLIATSPVGLVAVTGLKIGLVNLADSLPQQEKRLTLKSTSAVWGGAAVNNILVFLAAPAPFPILAGFVAGIMTWNHLTNQYEKDDIRLAAQNSKIAKIRAKTAVKTVESLETSGE